MRLRGMAMHFAKICGAVTMIIVTAPPLLAQPERYELGQRLRSFENAWEQQADAAARKRTIEPLIAATRAFFSLRHGEAGRALDQARFALQGDQAPAAERLWAASLHVALPRRLLDVRQRKLNLTLQPFYKVDSPTPPKAELRLRLVAQDGGRELAAGLRDAECLSASPNAALVGSGAGGTRTGAGTQTGA